MNKSIFISYMYTLPSGIPQFGNDIIERDCSIYAIDDIIDVENFLAEKLKVEKNLHNIEITLLNFKDL